MTPPDQPEDQPSALSRLERALAGFGEPRPPEREADDGVAGEPAESERDEAKLEPDSVPEPHSEADSGPDPGPVPEPEPEEDEGEAGEREEHPRVASSPRLDIASAVEAVERLTAARESNATPSDHLTVPSPDAERPVLETAAWAGFADDDEPRFRPAELRSDQGQLDEDEDQESDSAAEPPELDIESFRVSDAAGSWQREVDDPALPYFLVEEDAPVAVAPVPTLEELRHAPATVEANPTTSVVRTLAEIPILLIVAALIAFLVKTFLAQAYYIPSGSMLPQLQIDDRVVVSKLAYKAHDPRRGDIIVFDDPTPGAPNGDDESFFKKIGEGIGIVQPSTDEFIKRVIGLPGDTVEGKDGHVYVNGHLLVEPYLKPDVVTSPFDKVKVNPGRLWVMGDNRSGSADSRFFGQVKIDTIVGRAVVRVWPASHISFL